MAVQLHSYKIDKDGEIRVRHTFYAATEEEAEDLMDAHAEGCTAYGQALDSGDTIEIFEDGAMPDVAALELVADAQDREPPEDDDMEPDEDQELEDDE